MPSVAATLLGYPALAPAARLDRELGDPDDDATVFSFARCEELERSAQFPAEICATLDRLGLPRYYVPARHGGALVSYEQTLHLLRTLARRDLGVAVAHGQSYLGAVAVWVAGSPPQAAWLGEQIMAGVPASLALTERAHGSDLVAGEVSAKPSAGGYLLSGEKWLINNATRGQLVCVLARTSPSGGPRGFSLLLVDKRQAEARHYRHLSKVDTYGIRVADISGIVFDQMPLPAEALVGTEGAGLEILLRALQLTRTCAGALSLGAADHALAIAVPQLAGQNLGRAGGTRSAVVRTALGRVYAMLFVAEALSLVACRSVHVLAEEMSVISAVAKYLVPTLVDELVEQLGALLGPWSCLDAPAVTHRFSQVERDHRIVGIFDGNTFVNQSSLVNQFPVLYRGYQRRSANLAGLEVAATLGMPLPEADLTRLSLLARHGCTLLQALPAAVDEMAALAASGEVDRDVAAAVRDLATAVDEIHAAMAAPSRREIAPRSFELARRYAWGVGAAACVQIWARNRGWPVAASSAAPWSQGQWLHACLVHVLQQLRPGRYSGRDRVFTQLFDALAGRVALGGWPHPVSLLAPAPDPGELGR